LKNDPRYPTLRFKRIGKHVTVRVDLEYRAVGIPLPDGVLWFWIGPHDEYERLIR